MANKKATPPALPGGGINCCKVKFVQLIILVMEEKRLVLRFKGKGIFGLPPPFPG